jgi:protein PsiE
MKRELGIGKTIHQLENIFLLVIALFTVIGAGKEIYLIADKRDVGLQDLLLMFLYVEVLAMVGAYYDSKQIPITLPIFIAITALARLTILQKDQEPLNLIYEAGAILILAMASVIVNYRPARAARTIDRETSKTSAGLRPGFGDH